MDEERMQMVDDYFKNLSEGERRSKVEEVINYIIKNLEKEKQLTLC